MLKVIHVSETDVGGGAAIAAHRLHKALCNQGVESRFVVLRKLTNDPTVLTPLGSSGLWRNYASRALSRLVRSLQRNASSEMRSINLLPSGLGRWLNSADADVINLHWVGADVISLAEIANIRKPVVWTMHDMWAFCGTEHYDPLENPGCFRVGYSPPSRRVAGHGLDLDAWNYRRKQRLWRSNRFHLVCPSNWMARNVANSTLFNCMPCRTIPNGLDLTMFRRQTRASARDTLGLPRERQFVLFGAANSTRDPRKGFHLLLSALQHLASRYSAENNVELLVFGSESDVRRHSSRMSLPIWSIGQISDTEKLATLYSAADLFVAPSVQDNLPNTLIEAHACGTPCVAFDIGGMAEVIDAGTTGWLARPFDARSLCDAIVNALKLPSIETSIRCREHAMRHFSDALMAQRYHEFYGQIAPPAQGQVPGAPCGG